MKKLNTLLNNPSEWKTMLLDIDRRVDVDMNEIQRVLELARRTPGLVEYEKELQQLAIFFESATIGNQQHCLNALRTSRLNF